MPIKKRLQSIAMAAASLLVIPACNAAAQGAQMNMNFQVQGIAVDGGMTGRRHSTTSANQMAMFLEMHIEQMQSVCELSDGQVKKLALAGKSTSRKLLSSGGIQMQFNLGRAGSSASKVDENSLSDEDAESQQSDEAEGKPDQKLKIKKQVSLDQVTTHAFWKKAIKSILTDEQRDKWNQSRTDRDKTTRDLLVNHRVADLALQLLLRPKQVAAVAEIVDRVEGNQLVKNFTAGGNTNMMRILKQGKKHAKVSEDDLKDVLTAVQMKVWKTSSRGNSAQGVIGKALGMQPAASDDGDSDIGVEFDGGGLTVKSIAAKSLAASLGIQVGDVIDTVDGEPVDTSWQFESAMKKAGKNVSVAVLRDNVEVRLEKK